MYSEKIFFTVVGLVLGWLFQQYRLLVNEDVNLVNEHIKDLEKFRDHAVDYWLAPFENLEKDKILAAKVRASQAAFSILFAKVVSLADDGHHKYEELVHAFDNAATGGNFEVNKRKLEPETAIEVYDRAAQLINYLRSLRRSVISLRRPLEKLIPRIDFKD